MREEVGQASREPRRNAKVTKKWQENGWQKNEEDIFANHIFAIFLFSSLRFSADLCVFAVEFSLSFHASRITHHDSTIQPI
jgi:hypothetical protein